MTDRMKRNPLRQAQMQVRKISGYEEPPPPPAPRQRARLSGTQRAIVVLLLLVLALVWGLLAIFGQVLWL